MHPWPCIKHFKPTLTDLTVKNYTGIVEEKKNTSESSPFFSEFAWLCHSLSFIIFHSNNQALILSSSVQNYILTMNFFIDFIHNIKKKKTQNFTLMYSVPMTFQTKILEVNPFISSSTISNIIDTKEKV